MSREFNLLSDILRINTTKIASNQEDQDEFGECQPCKYFAKKNNIDLEMN